jgi:branched-chain amino acid transport system permease protein
MTALVMSISTRPSNDAGKRILLVAGIPVAALLFLPLILAEFQRIFVAEIFIWGLFAMSFALVYGYGGMLSFAQAVFFGAGCYGFNLGTFYYGFNTWGAIISAVVAAIALAAPIGLIATRARSHHFLIVTVIFSVLVYMILSSGHWRWIAGPYVTRSLTFVPEVPLGFVTLSYSNEIVVYYFTLAFVALTVGLCALFVSSPFGRALVAQKDNEMRAQLIGLNIVLLRFTVFVVAAAVAGLSGALYALLARYTNLEFFNWSYSGLAVVMAVIGGVNSLIGPFIGTAIYMVAAEHLSRYFESFAILIGIILILVVRYTPMGVWGLIQIFLKKVSGA